MFNSALGIELATPRDLHTFWSFGDRGSKTGYDIVIWDVYREPPESLEKRILTKGSV
jgi:hypothetical protein